jgi:hypothetical protein
MIARRIASWLLGLACSSGCSSDLEVHAGEPEGACNAVETRFENGTRDHIAECSDIEYPMSPPTVGDHYPVWAAYRTYDYPVPLGYLVHSLEHGAVVFFYDCPDECEEEVGDVQAFIDQLPSDARCSEAVKRRVVLVPRPGLGARWAASAWGYALTADCFDRELFQRFYDAHAGQAPENLCNQGIDVPENACR